MSLNSTFPLLLFFSAGMRFTPAWISVDLSLGNTKVLGMPWPLLLLFLLFTYTLLLETDIKEQYDTETIEQLERNQAFLVVFWNGDTSPN